MRRDRIDALAEQLFAAAREERPDRELSARVERATAQGGDAIAGSGERAREGHAAIVRRPWLMRGLLAASVCGGLAAFVLVSRTHDAVLISAERAPGVAAKPAALPSAAELDETQRSLPEAPAAPAPDMGSAPTGGAPRSSATPPVAPAHDVPRRAARPNAAQRTPADERAAAPASTPTLSNELGALKQIRQALRNGDGGAALVLLDRYDGGEYGSSLALEASVLRIEALDAVGRRSEAEALARRFVRDNPDSPLAERAQRWLDRTEPAQPVIDARP
jgi:hypothetical protein